VADTTGSDRVLQEATEALRTGFDVYFSTLQVEQECLDEQAAGDIDITRRPHPGR
jgi:cobalt-zinc-cadmium efflux system protein